MNRRVLYLFVAAFAIGVALFAGARMFFGDDPAEVALEESAEAPRGDASYDGAWTVEPGTGAEDETFSGYRIEEEFAGVGANTAVGRTGDVQGTLDIDGSRIVGADITVDMTTLQSDQKRRDDALRTRGLQTDEFPTATFSLAKPITIASEPKSGEKIEAEATGALMLHGVTRTITIPIEGRRAGDRITVISSFEVNLDDYKIERPTTARVVSIAGTGKVELQLHFVKES